MLNVINQLFFLVEMDPPPSRRGWGRPRRNPNDEKTASTPHNPQPQSKPQEQPEFQVPPMPQPGFFPPMTPEAYQTYMNFLYAQTQAQAQASQVSYPVPPPATFAQPLTQSKVKLSKLIKKARLLGRETFSGTVDAVVAKNWLKRVTDTLTDMELNDSLKLKVATRLMDKNATTWWDNLKLRISTSITWELFVQEFNDQF